ncbi:MAG TPA: PEGA domain-containing protein [Candidatus Binatia bacterium]|nr:PEGA domain-containing protein [Candidatus Binatia bacterium]
MDFIDPHIRRINKIKLLVGYCLITLAVIMTTLVLLYQAYGYGFGKNGQIIQNGLVYISSNPNPASIYLNGVNTNNTTNARLELQAGQYTVTLERSGYRNWQRAVGVEGGSVEQFYYPFLFPKDLVTTNVASYSAQPGLILQSPSRRYLLIQQPANDTTYDEYDLSVPKQLKPTEVTIPNNIATPDAAGVSSTWQLVAWSTDNVHVLLDRVTAGTNDYILFNIQTPDQSIDLTKTLNLNNTTVPALVNNNYTNYYLFDQAAGTLSTASLSGPQPTPLLEHVLSYKSYGTSSVLYVTDNEAPTGTVLVRWLQGSTDYTVRQLQAGATTYLLDLTQYSGNWYVVAGDSSESKTYVYENPQNILGSQPVEPLVPVAILKVNDPTYEAFSANAQFIMAENGNSFSVYDADNSKSYSYITSPTMAAGEHATWMDGDRLIYTAGGHVIVFDYDDANQQTLQPGVDGTLDYFDQSYKWSYNLNATTDPSNPFALSQTSMLIPTDQ